VSLPSDHDDGPAAPGHDGAGDAGRVAEARAVLAAIQATVFPTRPTETRAEHRQRTAAFVTMLLSDD
jgi:hypothetical protein